MIVVEIYDAFHNKIDEVYNLLDLDLSVKLNDFGECSFRVANNNPALTANNFKDFNNIRVVESAGGVDTVYFYGYMKTIKLGILETTVYCRTLEHRLERRKIRDTNLFISSTLTAMMTTLVSAMDSYQPTGITLDCTSTSLITLKVISGQSLLQTLKDISNKGFQFTITTDRRLVVADSVGIDRSVPGANFVEMVRNNQTTGRNIKDATKTIDADDRANGIMGKSNSEVSDSASIAAFGTVEDTVTNISTAADELETMNNQLAKKKDGSPTYEIEPEVDNFFFAGLGDQIKVTIDTGNPLFQYEGPMIVTEKRIKFGIGKQVSVVLSTNGVNKSKDFVSVIKSLNERITKQELQ